jgi:hypothetical protein
VQLGAVASIIDTHLRDPGLSHCCNLLPTVGMVIDAEHLDHMLPVFEQLKSKPRFLGVWTDWNAKRCLPSKPFVNELSLSSLPPARQPIPDPAHVEPNQVLSVAYVSLCRRERGG